MKNKTIELNFGWPALLALALVTQTSRAVMLYGSGDPAYNTTPPTGALQDSGWQYEGQWGGFLGTPIAPQYFIAARHIGGSVGQAIVFNGVSYPTTARWDDPNTDLRIWKIAGTFPAYAPLYPLDDETGKTLVVFGRGTQRGQPVTQPQWQAQTVILTNVVDLKSLGISKKDAQAEFPEATFKGQTMTVVSSELVTNTVQALKGWQAGPADGALRWGVNRVYAAGGCLVGAFTGTNGVNEAYLSSGDSSGAVFIQDNGVWKLAGLNYGIDGPFAASSNTPAFYGAIYNENGLYVNGYQMPDDGLARPAYFYATRISASIAWIQGIISQ